MVGATAELLELSKPYDGTFALLVSDEGISYLVRTDGGAIAFRGPWDPLIDRLITSRFKLQPDDIATDGGTMVIKIGRGTYNFPLPVELTEVPIEAPVICLPAPPAPPAPEPVPEPQPEPPII
jgi:hypothetical protein